MLTSSRNIVRYFVFALLAIALPLATQGQESKLLLRTISVNNGRPMMEAIDQLRARYGWLISYQDPPYEHPDDLMLREGAPRRHMVPRRMSVSVDYMEPQAGDLQGRHRTIDRIVEGFSAAGAGQFRVHHWGSYSYVVPVSVKRANGVLENLPSICEMTVSFPPAMRTIDESLALILPRISQWVHAPIGRGADPINLFIGHRYLSEAEDEPVCALMSRIFEGPNPTRVAVHVPPVHIVWDLLYDATAKQYFFNAAGVNPPKAPPPYVRVEPQKTDK